LGSFTGKCSSWWWFFGDGEVLEAMESFMLGEQKRIGRAPQASQTSADIWGGGRDGGFVC
jgi:hypothetical protein